MTGLPVIVDFYSDSCGPCRMMAPIFKKVASEFIDKAVFVKIDTNRQYELSSRYQVHSLPTFSYFVNQKRIDSDTGGIGEGPLRQATQKAIRAAQLENTLLELSDLVEYYNKVDPNKSDAEIAELHEKCASMTKHNPDHQCVGNAANQLVRRLKKKYKQGPKTVPRFTGEADSSSSDSGSSSNKSKQQQQQPSNKKKTSLQTASIEELQAELEKRLDELRDEQVEHETQDDADHEYNESNNIWQPSEFPEKVVVIGSGPAGLAAALYAARAGLQPLVIAPSMGGQLQGKGVEVENYPGLFNVTGPNVIAQMRSQASYFRAVFEDDIVNSIQVNRDPAQLYANQLEPILIRTNTSTTIETHSVIVATGAEANWLQVPGEYELRGGGVSSCAVCDGFLYSNQNVVVVGGGDAAMEDALLLARTSSSVTVIHRRDTFRASKVLADRVVNHPKISILWNTTLQEIVGKSLEPPESGDDSDEVNMDELPKVVQSVVLKDVSTGETFTKTTDAVFVAIGHTPATQFLNDIVEFQSDHPGYIRCQGDSTATSVLGIFAAGDVSDPVYRQAITSSGAGAAAALDAERYLHTYNLGREKELLEAELLADLLEDTAGSSASYNAYDDAGGKQTGMKESIGAEL